MPEKTLSTCSAGGCDRPAWVRGLCQTHYHRQWGAKNRPPQTRIKDRTCDVEGCEERGYSQWTDQPGKIICKRHYGMLRKRGTIQSAQRAEPMPYPACAAEGCEKLARSRTEGSLCENHYQQERRRARGLQRPGPKPDPSAPHSRYSPGRSGEGTRDGVTGAPAKDWESTTHCPNGHEFVPTNTYLRERGPRTTKSCRRCSRDARIRSTYGLEPMDWDSMLIAQAGRCAVCADPMTEPFVDHDHTSGKVRALLCRCCNTGLGQFGDDPARLKAALDYIDRYRPS